MNILILLAMSAGLIACISLLWLAGRAFGRHPGWGLAVLFLSPLAATLFGIQYWRDEKAPFLVHITTLAATVTIGLYLFAANGGWIGIQNALLYQQVATAQTTSRAARTGFVPANLKVVAKSETQVSKSAMTDAPTAQTQAAQQNRAAISTNVGVNANTEPGLPKVSSAKPIEPKIHLRASYMSIDPSLAGDYVGMTVKVKRRNRPEQDCMLKRVSPTTLAFEQHSHGGTFSFQYRQSDIEKLRVLVKQSY